MIDSERDRAADQAYRDHANDVYRVAYGILRDPDEALDATHDTFARAWERWDQYDSQRPLRGWLHGIVVHLALDQLRRRRVRRLALPVLGRDGAALERTLERGPGRRRRATADRRARARRAQAGGPRDARPPPLLRLRLRPDRDVPRDQQRDRRLDAVRGRMPRSAAVSSRAGLRRGARLQPSGPSA